ncbi:MAG: C4-dicarboxylate ABC transporter permease [Rhodobacteraceae bacterium]|nr:MAG: C4-dicarboxylate ABC transporter permease [Paracoccaceae bacterium]
MSDFFSKLEFVVGFALLAIITGLVFIAAVMRFFGHPLIWSVDLAQLLFIWLCFVGATRAMRQRSHLGVDFLVRFFSHKRRLHIETALALVILTFLGILTWHGYKLTMLNSERIFGDSGLSYGFVTAAVPVGSLFLSSAIIANMIEAWRGVANNGPLIFARLSSDTTPTSEL